MSNNKTANEIIEQINILNRYFRLSRSFFPFINDEDIGETSLTKYFNLADRTKVSRTFNFLITKDFQIENNAIAHYLNQNFLIRLCAVLDQAGLYKIYDENKYPQLEILQRLRQKFAHTIGSYNPDSKRRRQKENDPNILEDIKTHFHLPGDFKDFIISIDTVINPIINSSIQCVKELYP